MSNKGQSSAETQFFLYTAKLNENATKNLRKTSTNKEERKALSQIFGLSHAMNKTGTSGMSG